MSTAPSSNGSETKTGLKIDRVFSDPTVHPFDQITWTKRTAEIKDEKGNYVFKQEDVEFPESWSQLAVNIVASKYFYGPLDQGNGSPADGKREYSARQLIGRVAKTIATWGWNDGYFDTHDDYTAFESELTHLLIQQYGAFNSPVWFNVGLWDQYKVPGDYDGFYFDVDKDMPSPVPQGRSLKHPQGSACFLVGVEDSIASIYERAVVEGRLFKYGSGCGTNNSKIRSKREFVRGGGRPSGPISFMSVYDAVAKVTKSGGRSRRAAKAELIDDWHPDVLDFIQCKGVEEAKAHALIREGYESNFNGEAYTTVCFQNSNMSVRFSDVFMKKLTGIDPDTNWQTIAVTTGTPFNTGGEKMPNYDVGFLFNEVAAGTWRCGDPGVMFTDTIQKWHTCKTTGAIECANPCMEFLFLTDTACNLAALNLIKFLKTDGTFDAERFQAAVRIFIIAQEIIVDRAGYPTEKICQNSHDYRPLGLGYCNLGALLMSKGLPYDSNAGRNFAGAITAIMDSQAHLTSCDLARVQGVFPGYEANRESYLDVMRLHRDAAYDLYDTDGLEVIARKNWDDVVAMTSLFGARNAQTSLLMPTGTVAFMLDAATTGIEPDIALVKYKVLAGGGSLRYTNQEIRRALDTIGCNDADEAIRWVEANGSFEGYAGIKPEHLPVFDCAFPPNPGGRSIAWTGHIDMMAAVQPFLSGAISKCVSLDTLVTTSSGLIPIGEWLRDSDDDSFTPLNEDVVSLGGIENATEFYNGGLRETKKVTLRSGHSVTCTPNHPLLTCDKDGLAWVPAEEIKVGDFIAVRYGADSWGRELIDLSGFSPNSMYGCQKRISVPDRMTEDLALLLGMYAAEGNTTSTYTVHITKGDRDVIDKAEELFRSVFGIESKITRDDKRCLAVHANSKTMTEFMSWLGCGRISKEKRIPSSIMRSPKSVVLKFLQGLFLDSYFHVPQGKWGICLASKEMIDDVSALLTNLGVVHGQNAKWNAEYERYYHEIFVYGNHTKTLAYLIEFLEPHKRQAAEIILSTEYGQSTADVIPGELGRELYDAMATCGVDSKVRFNYRCFADKRTKHLSRAKLEEIIKDDVVPVPQWAHDIIENNLRFSPVKSVEDAGDRYVADISVPATKAFIGNGIVNHNTVNMPESSTVEDIRDAYVYAWKQGLKCVAIYRENSKASQPLNTKADAKEAKTVPQPVPVAPQRKRLPETRQAVVHKFEIGGHEGYVTVGLYPDGTPGELFVTIAKEGSTISGLLDAWATCVSIALQYGVPLDVLVNKFVHSRYEPSGFTQNKSIRIASSLTDYIVRWLSLTFIPKTDEETGMPIPMDDFVAKMPQEGQDAIKKRTAELIQEVKAKVYTDSPSCPNCGSIMQRAGTCHTCTQCGTSSGCAG